MATPKAYIHSQAKINDRLNVTFGYGCFVHPFAKITVEGGCTIHFGDYNIIEENVLIKAYPKGKENFKMTIGNYNYFKSGCTLENTIVQNYNVFENKCKLTGSYVESGTIISPFVELKEGKTVKNNGIIFPQNKVMFNSYFDEEEFKKKIQGEVSLLNQVMASTTRPDKKK